MTTKEIQQQCEIIRDENIHAIVWVESKKANVGNKIHPGVVIIKKWNAKRKLQDDNTYLYEP